MYAIYENQSNGMFCVWGLGKTIKLAEKDARENVRHSGSGRKGAPKKFLHNRCTNRVRNYVDSFGGADCLLVMNESGSFDLDVPSILQKIRDVVDKFDVKKAEEMSREIVQLAESIPGICIALGLVDPPDYLKPRPQK